MFCHSQLSGISNVRYTKYFSLARRKFFNEKKKKRIRDSSGKWETREREREREREKKKRGQRGNVRRELKHSSVVLNQAGAFQTITEQGRGESGGEKKGGFIIDIARTGEMITPVWLRN